MPKEISLETIKNHIRTVSDFPKPGIQFKDITTVLRDGEYFSFLVDTIIDLYKECSITKVVGLESRGFILGGAIAAGLNAGFVPIRKQGKLPAAKYSKKYKLEYGSNTIEIHKDALEKGDTLLLHDDLLATGGTTQAAIELLNLFEPEGIYINFLCELDFLNGSKLLKPYNVISLIHL